MVRLLELSVDSFICFVHRCFYLSVACNDRFLFFKNRTKAFMQQVKDGHAPSRLL